MAASGAKYGLMTSHFYWVGAIPAMVFVGIFMMPFYYGSEVRSVPEYLKLRFDEKTRALNAFSFAGMTVFSSGISMYAMAILLELLLGWNFNFAPFFQTSYTWHQATNRNCHDTVISPYLALPRAAGCTCWNFKGRERRDFADWL